MFSAVFTTARRTMGTRVAPRSPILMPAIEMPKRIAKPCSGGEDIKKKFTVVAIHGGGPLLRTHTNPTKLSKLPHDADRFSGRIIQAKQSYGYIVDDKTKETVFYHIKNVDLKGYIRFNPGQKVTFTLTKFGNRTVAGVVRPMVQQYRTPTEIDMVTGAIIKPAAAAV